MGNNESKLVIVDGLDFQEALAEIVAEKIHGLRIPYGAKLITPTAALLARGIRHDPNALPHLADLQKEFVTAIGTVRFSLGRELGDRAMYSAGGLNSHQNCGSPSYAREMAFLGYRGAQAVVPMVAKKLPETALREVTELTPPLLEHYEDVVRVLASLDFSSSLPSSHISRFPRLLT